MVFSPWKAAVFSFGLAGIDAPGQELRFHPAEGSSLRKFARTVLELELAEASLTANGKELSRADFGLVDVLGRHRLEGRMVVTDEYESVAHDHPYSFRRIFELVDVSGTSRRSAATRAETWERPSPLEGARLRIDWHDKEHEFEVELEEGSRELLPLVDDLPGDMDLLALLPIEPAELGDRWRIDVRDFLAAVFFDTVFGSGWSPEDRSISETFRFPHDLLPRLPEEPRIWIRDLEGHCDAKLMAGEDGAALGRIEIDFDLKAEQDLIEGRAPHGQLEFPFSCYDELRLAWSGTGTAELLWNLDAGRLERFELSADLSASLDAEVSGLLDFAVRDSEAQRWTRNRLRSHEKWKGRLEIEIGLGYPFDDD